MFCRPSQKPVLATANTGKTPEKFFFVVFFWGGDAVEWTGRVEISRKSLAVSTACMAIIMLTYSRL